VVETRSLARRELRPSSWSEGPPRRPSDTSRETRIAPAKPARDEDIPAARLGASVEVSGAVLAFHLHRELT